jgi:ribonuclease HI
MNLEIWTDGSCWPNPGNGAWAFVILSNDEVIVEKSGFCQNVTNNRMEYQALIEAFDYIKREKIWYERLKVYSDSNLLVQTITQWMERWKSNGWRRTVGRSLKPIANLDLVKKLDQIKSEYDFDIKWVKGHADIKWNERCDQLCRLEFNNRGLKSFEELREEGKLFR